MRRAGRMRIFFADGTIERSIFVTIFSFASVEHAAATAQEHRPIRRRIMGSDAARGTGND